MNTFLFSTYDTWSTRNPYRMGNVGMSSSMVSMVSFYSAICMMFSQVRADTVAHTSVSWVLSTLALTGARAGRTRS